MRILVTTSDALVTLMHVFAGTSRDRLHQSRMIATRVNEVLS